MISAFSLNRDQKVIGRFPQIEPALNNDKSLSEFRLDRASDNEILEGLILPNYKLCRGAKYTDLIIDSNLPGKGFLIKADYVGLIRKMRLDKSQFIPVKVFENNLKSFKNYNYTQLVSREDLIDFSLTIFRRIRITEEIEKFTVTKSSELNPKELAYKKDGYWTDRVEVSDLKFNEKALELDLFVVPSRISREIFVNNKYLKDFSVLTGVVNIMNLTPTN